MENAIEVTRRAFAGTRPTFAIPAIHIFFPGKRRSGTDDCASLPHKVPVWKLALTAFPNDARSNAKYGNRTVNNVVNKSAIVSTKLHH